MIYIIVVDVLGLGIVRSVLVLSPLLLNVLIVVVLGLAESTENVSSMVVNAIALAEPPGFSSVLNIVFSLV